MEPSTGAVLPVPDRTIHYSLGTDQALTVYVALLALTSIVEPFDPDKPISELTDFAKQIFSIHGVELHTGAQSDICKLADHIRQSYDLQRYATENIFVTGDLYQANDDDFGQSTEVMLINHGHLLQVQP